MRDEPDLRGDALTRTTIRPETATDSHRIAGLVGRAYADVPYSDHREQDMIGRLRGSAAFVPELSLIAERAGEAVGHILLTRIAIEDDGVAGPSLALAPLSVVPEQQRSGVGSALVREAHRRAAALGFPSIILIGIPGYYERFGYRPLASYPITVPFDVSMRNCMAIALRPGGLDGVRGTITYPAGWLA